MNEFWSVYEGVSGGFRGNVAKSYRKGQEFFDLNTRSVDPTGRDFRIFFPPGTAGVGVTFNTPPASWCGTASRLGQYPEFDVGRVNRGNFLSVRWDGDNGANRDMLEVGDRFARNVGGHGTVAYWRSSNYAPMLSGKWLYCRLIETTDRISNVGFRITVMANMFFDWFNSENTKWDQLGNPISETFVTPPITPGMITLPTGEAQTPVNGTGEASIPQIFKIEWTDTGKLQLRDELKRFAEQLMNA